MKIIPHPQVECDCGEIMHRTKTCTYQNTIRIRWFRCDVCGSSKKTWEKKKKNKELSSSSSQKPNIFKNKNTKM